MEQRFTLIGSEFTNLYEPKGNFKSQIIPFLYTQMCYNVYMKEKQIHIRADEKFLQKLEYLMRINGFKSLSDTIRRIIEKEYRKEKGND